MKPDALLDEFIRHLRVERGLSRNTWLSYGYQIKGYLAFLAARGKGPLSAGRDDVLAHLEAKKDGGRQSASIFAVAIAVRQFHRFLHEQGHAAQDPTQGMRLPKFEQHLPEFLSTTEMEQLLAAHAGAKFTTIRDRAMIELMYATGMRVSELTGLRLGQLDLETGWVRVLGKGSKERIIPFGPRAAAVLRSYLDARAGRFPTAPDALFLNVRGGGPITRGGFAWRLAAVARRAGLSGGVAPHQIRHTCATHMLMGGAELRMIAEMLGHRTVVTTQRYTHVTATLLRTTCEKTHPGYSAENRGV